jgi:hypothetical protein
LRRTTIAFVLWPHQLRRGGCGGHDRSDAHRP